MITKGFAGYQTISHILTKFVYFSQKHQFSNISPKQCFTHQQHPHDVPTC